MNTSALSAPRARRAACLAARCWPLLAGALALCPAQAAQADPAAVQKQARQFLLAQSAGLPGKVAIEVQAPRGTPSACAVLEAFQPAGSRDRGKTVVGVRCLAPGQWTVYVPAEIRVTSRYVVTRQALPARHTLSAADLALREGDIGGLPADIASDPATLVGHRTVSGVAAGAPLRASLLQAPLVVQQGQPTRLVMNGPGFSVHSAGQALGNGSRGERVRVRTLSGQVVSGIAEDGQQVVVAY
jgi:flagella basal body P-ring formation protein FlgA